MPGLRIRSHYPSQLQGEGGADLPRIFPRGKTSRQRIALIVVPLIPVAAHNCAVFAGSHPVYSSCDFCGVVYSVSVGYLAYYALVYCNQRGRQQ